MKNANETISSITAGDKPPTAPMKAKVTLPPKADKAARAKQIDEAAAKVKAGKVEAPKPEKKEKPAKPDKPAKNPNVLSVSDVARELGVDPKRARARLRAAGLGAVEGRWATVERGTPLFVEWSSIINPSDEPEEKDDEESEDEE